MVSFTKDVAKVTNQQKRIEKREIGIEIEKEKKRA